MNAVITYIFGNNLEILREPLVIDPTVDYICVTDQYNLVSNNWRIIIDKLPSVMCTRDKMPLVKYNPFKYTNAENIIVMDGALQITQSLNDLFNQLNDNDLLIKPHPSRSTLRQELTEWVEKRHMDPTVVDKFKTMSNVDHISLDNNFLIESCIIGYHVSPRVVSLCRMVLNYMSFLGRDSHLCMTNQCPFTYCIEKCAMRYSWIRQQDWATRYKHHSWDIVDW